MNKKKNVEVSSTQFSSEDASLALYLKEIAKTKPLTSKEEADLTVRIRNGDQEALHKLVQANLRFVVSVSRSYQNQGLPLSDLINEGNLGLITAAQRFDEKKNFRFISYAVWWIRQAILKVLAENSRIVRLPLNRVGDIHKIGVAQRKLEQQLRRLPTTNEIAEELKLQDKDVQNMIMVGSRHTSLDAPLSGNSDGDMHEVFSCNHENEVEDKMFNSSLQKEITRVLGMLSPREREIITLYFGIGQEAGLTLEDIGKKYNLTRERVRQIREKAMKKLQRYSSCNGLNSFLYRG